MLETELELPRELRAQKALKHPRLAAELLHAMIGTLDREHFVAFYLDSKRVVTHAHIVSRGTVQTALVHPREVFKGAVLANAVSLIVGHNHPSGVVMPSTEDLKVFDRLTAAGETLGITVLDALIVGPCDEFHSTLSGVSERLSNPLSQGESETEPVVGENVQGVTRQAQLEQVCENLLQDIDEVLERQGEDWWDETVTAGTEHRANAEELIGRVPYAPMLDDVIEPT